MRTELLSTLENNARITTEDLASILGASRENVEKEIEELEAEKIICGYHTLINWDKVGLEKADALIEVKVAPQRGVGFDQFASKVYEYPEVDTVYLISGACDFVIFLQGRSMREIAMFVSEKLATIENVLSTNTLFILKKYKQNGFKVESAEKDRRIEIS